MRLHRHPLVLRGYGLLPHRLLNGLVARLARAPGPQPAVQAAIRHWIRRGAIDLTEYEPGPWPDVESFFLRRLRGGARPLAAGVVSPCDGCVVSAGAIGNDGRLLVKGRAVDLARLINGRQHALDVTPWRGGAHLTVFLTPDGYHHVHAPFDADWVDVRWIPGRFFPQNDDALRHIPRVYERNERAVLRLRRPGGEEALLVMVGASLVGGIHLAHRAGPDWQRPTVTVIGRPVAKGERLGHFAFGSTVVLLRPRGAAGFAALASGAALRQGAAVGDLDGFDTTSPPRPAGSA